MSNRSRPMKFQFMHVVRLNFPKFVFFSNFEHEAGLYERNLKSRLNNIVRALHDLLTVSCQKVPMKPFNCSTPAKQFESSGNRDSLISAISLFDISCFIIPYTKLI